jgi:trans-2,3-dihydro-3-hydroxyanthranilate isomerase
MQLDYFVVDVFSQTPLEGNPLAVVMGPDSTNGANLTTERMQAIAREFNLSETTFVERRTAEVEQREGVRVRIFTTQEELPFAGHPTLGTASVLRLNVPKVVQNDTVTLALNVGAVPVRFTADGQSREIQFGEMTQRDPEFGEELDAAQVARMCGLGAEDLDPALPPQVVSTGTPFAIVALKSHKALARLKVSQSEAMAWLRPRGARWFYVLAPAGSTEPSGGDAPAWRARMQFNGGEDPATGSAAGCAIGYLVQRGAVTPGKRVHMRQGVEMGRPSDLYLSAQIRSARVSEVRVAGSTVLVAKGSLWPL